MRRFLVLISASALLGGALAAATISAGAIDTYCTNSATGCAHAQDQTICSLAGAFGAFGKGNSLAGGADGDQTGFNNSTLCGNPQGNP